MRRISCSLSACWKEWVPTTGEVTGLDELWKRWSQKRPPAQSLPTEVTRHLVTSPAAPHGARPLTFMVLSLKASSATPVLGQLEMTLHTVQCAQGGRCPRLSDGPILPAQQSHFTNGEMALAGVAQGMEHRPANQRVAGSIPSQGTCLGCHLGPQSGAQERQPHIDASLPLFLPPISLKINK